jgi:hypothetical protein
MQAPRVPVLVVILGHRDLDVLRPDADGGQPGHDMPVQRALQFNRVRAHHEHLDQDQVLPVHPAVARVEAQLALLPRPEDLELVVGRDRQRVDERLVDLGADRGPLLLEEGTGQVDLDEGHDVLRFGSKFSKSSIVFSEVYRSLCDVRVPRQRPLT